MKSPRAVIERAMTKQPKDATGVEYSDTRGRPNHHCGPTRTWPAGYCKYFDAPDACWRVSGKISPKGGCDLWERATEA